MLFFLLLFKLISLPCCSAARPSTTDDTRQTIPDCPTPVVYDDEPYNIRLSISSIPPTPVKISDHYPTHQDSQLPCNGQWRRIPFSRTSVSGQCSPVHHYSGKKSQKHAPFETERLHSTLCAVKNCRTLVKGTELRNTTARAVSPSTVRVPNPRPRDMRTPVIEQREAQPTRYTPVIRSWNTDDSYNVAVGIPGESPVSIIPGHVIDSFFSPTEVMMDELLTCFVSQQDEYPNPPRGSLLLPLADSSDSLDSYTQFSVLASPNCDGSSLSSSEDYDAPLSCDYSLSPTFPGTVSNVPRPKASYGLPRGPEWSSTSPQMRPSIRYRGINNVAEEQACCNQCERRIITDQPKKRVPVKKRILAAFQRFHRPSNLIQVAEAKEVVDNSGRSRREYQSQPQDQMSS